MSTIEKLQAPSSKLQINFKLQNGKIYNLEERTFQFAKEVAFFCQKLPKSISNIEYSKQVIRSSGSMGSNYIEANECLSKKDFQMRIKICRKESKETVYWLRLIIETNFGVINEGDMLINEATELKKSFLQW